VARRSGAVVPGAAPPVAPGAAVPEAPAAAGALGAGAHGGGGHGGGATAVVDNGAPLDLDRLIHERLRLGIVSALAVNDRLSFHDLKELLRTTDGNLSVHARKLEEAGYVKCEKSFVGRLPKTEYRLTVDGKRALERYLNHMEAIIHATRVAAGDDAGAPR
jgi:DNA-binding MarR family transcriptional regulator